MRIVMTSVCCSMLLVGCQQMPDYSLSRQAKPIVKPVQVIKETPAVATAEKPKEIRAAMPSANYDGLKASEIPTMIKPMPTVVVQPTKKLADGRDMPAVQNLLASASDSLRQGKPEDAATSLERAQRLAPQSAVVYQRLAEVRLQQGRAAEAEQLARKAIPYAQSTVQQAALWRIIANAADRQGKTDTANTARDKVQQLEGLGDRG
ncbi:tetratricopeptide repeat protein [Agitococcus lubricus]|uniref:Tetratricopeptide repeat protein n=1 Tax=Agitococcus lubricus TaxID=1077255 RepID=A0A2T5IYY4_9GAMM|nr:tetratricopeptide repeat protein [Agitococcus lubricus]PTQ89214.1 tetratricopeptide repeat protein [Agitococcus lubricus]